MAFLPVDDQLELISRGTEEVIPLNDLRKKLEKSISCLLYRSDAADE